MALVHSPYNMRIKLTARGTRSHGRERRLTHAAAYPRRYAGNERMFSKSQF